jgi:hypothetical protein
MESKLFCVPSRTLWEIILSTQSRIRHSTPCPSKHRRRIHTGRLTTPGMLGWCHGEKRIRRVGSVFRAIRIESKLYPSRYFECGPLVPVVETGGQGEPDGRVPAFDDFL